MKRSKLLTDARLPDGCIWLWLLLTFVWVAANSSIAIDSVATGALISAALACIFSTRTSLWRDIKVSPCRLRHFLLYTGVFFAELVRANISMMRYVYSRRIDIEPGIVRARIALKSPIGRLTLASSIALTPGSLVVDIRDDVLFIHWLDVATTDEDEVTRIFVLPYEKHLEKVFG
jgi:multicomponent Na+:H+ antiporter subunit E